MIQNLNGYNPLSTIKLAADKFGILERTPAFYAFVDQELTKGGLKLESDEELTAAINLLKEMDII